MVTREFNPSRLDWHLLSRTQVNLRGEGEKLVVQGLTLDLIAGRDDSRLTGNHKWVNLLCRFSDSSSEPVNTDYINALFNTTYPSLRLYWQDSSYNTADIPSVSTQNWLSLPQTRSYYLTHPSMLTALFNDCTALHNPAVNYPEFYGINLILNQELVGSAYGGGTSATLDGVSRTWGVTWLPPFGYQNQSVFAHEMGHAYGLPHSNNSDNDTNPYDNPWDVMSDSYQFNEFDAAFRKIGQYTNAYHKDRLGYIPANKKYTVATPGSYTFTIDRLAKISSPNYYMAQIPLMGQDTFYTVEVRRDSDGDFDRNLPDGADNVVIYKVVMGRQEPAWLVGGTSDANSSNEASRWTTGETYNDPVNAVSITVNNKTADGYSVTVNRGTPPNKPDLQVSKAASANSVKVNEALSYYLKVENAGAASASNVVVTDILPTGLNFVSVTPSPNCSYNGGNRTVTCNVGTMVSGQVFNATITTTATTFGEISNTATATTSTEEVLTSNNSAAVTTLIRALEPDMRVTITDNQDPIKPGTPLVYEVRVENIGGAAADGVFITNTFPTEATNPYWSISYNTSIPTCSYVTGGMSCSVGTFQPGRWMVIYITVGANTEGMYTNSASAVISETDANPANNSDSETTNVTNQLPTATPTSTPEATLTPVGNVPTATETPTSTPTQSAGNELIANGGFEKRGADTKPNITPWQIKGASKDKAVCNKPDKTFAYEGDCAFRFRGGVGERSKLVQTLDISGLTFTANDTLDLSMFIQANGAVKGKIILRVDYSDDTPSDKFTQELGVTSGYANRGGTYNLSSGAVSAIKLQINHRSVSGRTFVDGVSLRWSTTSGIFPLPIAP